MKFCRLGKMLIITLFLSLVTWTNLARATGLPVFDGLSFTQLTLQLKQLVSQTELIKQQLDSLKNNQYQWGNSQSLINQLGGIINQKNNIAYSANDVNERFQRSYPGYQAPENFSDQYKNNVNTTQNTLNSVLQSMGSSANDFKNENSRLAFLQRQSQSSQGELQAIQASSQIASETVSQLQLLRQTVIAQSNAQSAYYAMQVQDEASKRASLEKVINAGSTEMSAYGTSGHELNPPDF